MRLSLSPAWMIGFLCLLPPATAAEPDPDALPPGAVARLGWSPLRIGYADFTLTPDGRTIVVVTPQGNLRRLDAQTGRLLERRQLTDRSDVDLSDDTAVHPAVLSANGETVVLYESTYTGPRLTAYDVASGKVILRRDSNDKRRVQSGILSPDGKQLAVIDEEKGPQDTVIPDEKISERTCLRLYDLQSGQMREIGTFPQKMLDIIFSADGKRLLVTQQDLAQTHNMYVHNIPSPHILTVFDLPSGKKLWRRSVWAMNFALNRDGTMVLASGCPNKKGWDPPGSFANADQYATGFHVLQMDREAKKLTERFVPCPLDPSGVPNLLGIDGFALAPDDRTVVINHFDAKGAAYIVSWDLRTQKEIRRFELPDVKRTQLVPFRMTLAAGGRTLLTKGEYLQRWDLTSGKSLFAPPPDNYLPDFPTQLAFTPDGKEMLACSNYWLLGRWNIATGTRLSLRKDNPNYGGTLFIRTPSGIRAIRYAESAQQVEFAVFDPVSQKTLHTLRWTPSNTGGHSHIRGATLSANGKTLLAIIDKHVTTWEVATGQKRSDYTVSRDDFTIGIHPFSPCGRWMLLSDKVHYVGDGTELFEPGEKLDEWLVVGDPWRSLQVWFSDDGRLMATAHRKKEVKAAADYALIVWELASGKVLARLERTGFIPQVAFAPNGRTITLLDAQGVRLEDLLGGKQRANYPAPDVIYGSAGSGSPLQTLVFAPDGSTLATGHQDGTIMLWKVPSPRPAHAPALADGETRKLWADLVSSSPLVARAAVDRLARHPDAAAAFLVSHFRSPPADARLAALLTDLDSDKFATREEASRQLRAYGVRAERALRRTLAKAPSLEIRRRIENILAEMPPPPLRLPLSGERLRGVRAIEVLERIGNAAARDVLHSWAEQTEDVHLAIEARMALERLDSSNPSTTP